MIFQEIKILGKYFSVLLIIIVFVRCQNKHNNRIHDNLAQKLSMADSLGSSDPETARNIYTEIISDESDDNRAFQAEALLGLSVVLTNSSKFDSALLFIEKAGQIAHELNDTLLLMKYYNSRGDFFHRKENFEETEKCFSNGLHLAELTGNEPNRHTFLLNLG